MSISQARGDVVQALERIGGMTRQNLLDLEIALGELLQNIVRHEVCTSAPCHFSIEVAFWGANLHISVIDSCEPLQDLSFLTIQRTASEEGGMGIQLIKKIASSYSVQVLSTGNRHELVFNDFLTAT
jgi:anti-sigma regulatory factor (Ser/Thr protein kinase)